MPFSLGTVPPKFEPEYVASNKEIENGAIDVL